MYLSTLTRPATTRGVRGTVPATVLGLGMVSLVTDVSAEMITAVLPLYLMYGVGAGFLQLGAVESLLPQRLRAPTAHETAPTTGAPAAGRVENRLRPDRAGAI